MDRVIDIDAQGFEKQVLGSDRPVVVEYWHHKCPSCEEMKPVYERMPDEMGGRVKFTRMNLLACRENRTFAIGEGVRSTPTFILYCGGRPTGVIVGVRGLEDFKAELENLLRMKDACLMGTPLEPE